MARKSFLCSLKSLSDVRETVETFCADLRVPDVVEGELELAANEACTNIVEHGGLNPDQDTFELSLERDNEAVVMTIRDKGRKYDFNRARSVRDKKEMKKRRPRSGMGIFIIRQLVDAVIYNHLPDKTNELKLIKYL